MWKTGLQGTVRLRRCSMTPEISRRCASLTLASLATLGCVPRLPVVASEPGVTPIGVAESKLPTCVIFMRAAELTGLQADMARRSAELTNEERFAQGIVVGRGQATKSIDYLLTNTGLRRLPGGAKPAETLTDVCRQLSKGDGPLTAKEYLLLASRYELAREQIERALQRLPEAERKESALVAEKLKAADEEAKRPFWSEEGKFASGQMGREGAGTLDEATRREREAYLADSLDAAREKLRVQRMNRATAKAESKLYGR